MYIRFKKDFADNWHAGQCVVVEQVNDREFLVGNIKIVDKRTLLMHGVIKSADGDTVFEQINDESMYIGEYVWKTYLFPAIKKYAKENEFEDPNTIVDSVYKWLDIHRGEEE